MAKKKRRREPGPREETFSPLPAAAPRVSSRGRKVVGAGFGLAALGLALLTLTDPRGRNWASSLCPWFILGGYALAAAGIFVPDPQPEIAPPAPPSPPAS